MVSYATRGMETLRGFPEFMRTLPGILDANETAHIVIAGADRRAYSYDAPIKGGSWKEYMLSELGDKLDTRRVIFCGLLTYEDYRKLLWRSDLHCYFTRPYVTSWSLFEAAACGAKLVCNREPATLDIAVEGTINWVELNIKKN